MANEFDSFISSGNNWPDAFKVIAEKATTIRQFIETGLSSLYVETRTDNGDNPRTFAFLRRPHGQGSVLVDNAADLGMPDGTYSVVDFLRVARPTRFVTLKKVTRDEYVKACEAAKLSDEEKAKALANFDSKQDAVNSRLEWVVNFQLED